MRMKTLSVVALTIATLASTNLFAQGSGQGGGSGSSGFQVGGKPARARSAGISRYTNACGDNHRPSSRRCATRNHRSASKGGSRNTKSNGALLLGRAAASHRSASALTASTCEAPHSRQRSCSAVTQRPSVSRQTTLVAPREADSRPSAPLPAKASSTRAPRIIGASQLKRVSRTRSGVGRIAVPAGKRIFRPRH